MQSEIARRVLYARFDILTAVVMKIDWCLDRCTTV